MTPKYNLGDKVKTIDFPYKHKELFKKAGFNLPEGIITGVHIYNCERVYGIFYDINDGLTEYPEDLIEKL
jgi:hypothetical protein